MDPNASPRQAQSAIRRKLIRGSFSMPAVLAIHNGSALAASSSSQRCVRNITEGPAPLLPLSTTTADGIYRVFRYSTSDGKKWIKVADLLNVATVGGVPFVAPSVSLAGYANYDTGWVQWGADGNGAPLLYAFRAPASTPTVTTTLVAVLFDTNGSLPNPARVVGFKQANQTTAPPKTSAITTSCWTSLKP